MGKKKTLTTTLFSAAFLLLINEDTSSLRWTLTIGITMLVAALLFALIGRKEAGRE